ncbi:phosphatase 2C-like domain-containing protein, partial [Roridomyces roridus]
SCRLLRAVNGTTVCVALVDGVHVANVGDCDSFLCWSTELGWETKDLAPHHSPSNSSEAERVRSEHPGEPECISADGRLLTLRAIGDLHFKLPNDLVQPLADNYGPSPVQHLFGHLAVNKTPPYMSHMPDVFHVRPPVGARRSFLVLASDGLDHLVSRACGKPLVPLSMARIAAAVGRKDPRAINMAVEVIWESLIGERDMETLVTKASRRDDVTVAVVPVDAV